MLFSSLYAFLKLSKTTSPQKRFPSDCIKLYAAAKVKIEERRYIKENNNWFLDRKTGNYPLPASAPSLPKTESDITPPLSYSLK